MNIVFFINLEDKLLDGKTHFILIVVAFTTYLKATAIEIKHIFPSRGPGFIGFYLYLNLKCGPLFTST